MTDIVVGGQTVRVAERNKYPASEVELADGTTVEANNSSEDTAAGLLTARVTAVEANELTRARKPGIIGSARLIFTGRAVNNETTTIGGEVYTAKTVGAVAASKQYNLGADTEGDIDNFIANFNAQTALNVVAVKVGTDTIVFKHAATPGGTPTPATTSVAVSNTQSNATFNVLNLNATGQTQGIGLIAFKRVTIDATNVLGAIVFELPFTPVAVHLYARNAAGVPLFDTTATAVISGTTVVLTPGAGATPLLATDTVDVTILGNQS